MRSACRWSTCRWAAAYRFQRDHRADPRDGRRRPGPASAATGQLVAEPRGDADDPGAISAIRAGTRPTSSWRRSPKPGRSIARTRRSRGRSISRRSRDVHSTTCSRKRSSRATQEIRERLRHGRLVRQRLRGQRRHRAVRRTHITSASRSRRTTIPRRSSLTAAPTPASAASSAIRWAPAWAPSRCATPTSSASPPRYAAGIAAARRPASAEVDARAWWPACAITATAWAFPPSTGRSVSTSAIWPTRWSSAAPSD